MALGTLENEAQLDFGGGVGSEYTGVVDLRDGTRRQSSVLETMSGGIVRDGRAGTDGPVHTGAKMTLP